LHGESKNVRCALCAASKAGAKSYYEVEVELNVPAAKNGCENNALVVLRYMQT
jgi:hypothetical protein